MELGILSFGDVGIDPATGEPFTTSEMYRQTLERIQYAEQVGLDFYGLGEHHLDQYSISNPGTVLAAAAVLTERIKLGSAVTVLSTEDPVRLYQQFTTLDQLSHGRAELLAGRGSFTESFPLFGASLDHYDELYAEKLDLLMRLDAEDPITWSGEFRPPLKNAHVVPRPYGDHLRILLGTGGNPASSMRAGQLGLPVVYAVIGGQPERFAPLVDLYRRASAASGHAPETQHVTMTGIGFLAGDAQDAKDTFFPYWLQVMEYGSRARGWQVPTRAEYDHFTDGARDLFVGTAEQIAGRILDVARATSPDRYGLQFDWSGVPHDRVMESIRIFGEEVRPLVEAGLAAG